MQFWATNDSQFHQTVRRLLLTADTFELIIGVRAVTSLVTFLRDGDTRSVLAATLIETHRITLCNISPVNVSRCFSQYYTLLMLLVQHWTRRVAVYLETHCNIGSKRASHRRTRHVTQVTQLFAYLLTQSRTAATTTSICLLLRHDSARCPRWPSTIAENLGRYFPVRSIQFDERFWIDYNGKYGN